MLSRGKKSVAWEESSDLVDIEVKPFANVGRPAFSKDYGSCMASLSIVPAPDFVPLPVGDKNKCLLGQSMIIVTYDCK